ncbi:MAG: transporter substrate-binding domain-containing protein [Desulfobacterales bacterium]|nr:transporter substrate-binding domain-containing protein [Desulfobacterales bacterium]
MKILALFICMILKVVSPAFAQDDGQSIRIAVKEFPPFVFKEVKGFSIDMARVICERHGLTPEFVYYDTVPAVLKAVETGECDINFSGTTITAGREKRLDFSHPFFDSGLIVAVKTTDENRTLNFVLKILRVVGYSLLAFLIGLTVVAHAIWFLERSDTDPKSFPVAYKRGIADAYWWAIVTMTTVGYGDKCPKKVIGRIIASVWMIIGIIWFAAFTATLTSSLTINRIGHGDIKGLTDLNSKRVAVIKGTTSENFLRYHDVTVMVVETLDDLIASLKIGNVEAVIYDAPALMYLAKKDPAIKVVGEMFDIQKYGVAFPQGGHNPHKELFNIAILEMQDSGEYRKLYNKWF